MESKLNALLANLTVEYHKLQNQHWYVAGSDFFQAHAQLEELYDGLLSAIDDVAELLLQLGGKPIASLAEVLSTADIAERYGFRLDPSHVALSGTCADCAAKGDATKSQHG